MTAAPTDSAGRTPLLEVKNLKKYFPIKKGIFSRVVGQVKAVDDVSFHVFPNETVGLVGESGCGKTTAGRTLLRLLEPTGGEVRFKDQNVFDLEADEMRKMRRHLQIIFQDPYSSLNPRMTVESIIGEAIEFHGIAKGDERREMVESLLERVGLQPSYITRYPHEFSGGQRQRIGIARALALNPDFIVCDEAVSALDVSVQAQVINLLQDLQEEFNLSYLFIAHDLSVVRHISDRIAVMYLGQVVEMSECDALFDSPRHPYTQALLSAIPQPNPRRKYKRVILEGDVPSPINPPSGCRFHTRCPAKYGPCSTHEPRTIEVEEGHFVRCHLYDPKFEPNDPAIWERLPNFVAKLMAEQEAAAEADGDLEVGEPAEEVVSEAEEAAADEANEQSADESSEADEKVTEDSESAEEPVEKTGESDESPEESDDSKAETDEDDSSEVADSEEGSDDEVGEEE